MINGIVIMMKFIGFSFFILCLVFVISILLSMYLIGINAKIGTNIPNKPVKYQSKSGNIGSIIVVSFWGSKYIKFVM